MSLKIRINENQLKKILHTLNEDSLPSLTILWLDDIMSLLASFSGKFYVRRSAERRKKKAINE